MNLNPLTQINLFEHKEIFNQLYKLSKNDTLPNKILLSGEKGIGKSTLAYHLINLVLSENEEHPYDYENNKINPDNKSYKLILNKSNPNFYLIDVLEEKKNIDINQVRELIINLNKSSFNNKKRFVFEMPMSIAKIQSSITDLLPLPPVLTKDQCEILSEADNVVSNNYLTIQDLEISPSDVEDAMKKWLWRYRDGGQFAKVQ